VAHLGDNARTSGAPPFSTLATILLLGIWSVAGNPIPQSRNAGTCFSAEPQASQPTFLDGNLAVADFAESVEEYGAAERILLLALVEVVTNDRGSVHCRTLKLEEYGRAPDL
jgi:hypothetical protein